MAHIAKGEREQKITLPKDEKGIKSIHKATGQGTFPQFHEPND